MVAKKQYAKRKAMYLNRCFQTGETPIAGPLIAEDGAFNNRGEDNEDDQGGETNIAPGASHYEPPPNPKPRSNVDSYPQVTPAASSTGKRIAFAVVKSEYCNKIQ